MNILVLNDIFTKQYNTFYSLWNKNKYYSALCFLSIIHYYIKNCHLSVENKSQWAKKTQELEINQDHLKVIVKDLSENIHRITNLIDNEFSFMEGEFLLMMTIYEDAFFTTDYLEYRGLKVPKFYLKDIERDIIRLGREPVNQHRFESAYEMMRGGQNLPITSSHWGFKLSK